MDLHYSDAIATEAEREAVDTVLGGVEPGRSDAVTGLRRLLLPTLHAVQSRIGWISPGALNYLSERLSVPPAEAYGVASFYALFALAPQPPTVVHVCDDIACRACGAEELCQAIQQSAGPEGAPCAGGAATWKRSPCLGLCEHGSAAFVQRAGLGIDNFTAAPVDLPAILSLLQGDEAVCRAPGGSARQVSPHVACGRRDSSVAAALALPPQEGRSATPTASSPGGGDRTAASARTSGVSQSLSVLAPRLPAPAAPQLRLLARVDRVDPGDIDAYRASGGYQALRIALDAGQAAVIREVTEARLTGRGGAAFPAGVKWKAVAEAVARPHFVVCNADESEPGTFKDRLLMEDDPFALIEALTIAGFACGAEQGYIYIRGEYPEAARRLQAAIQQARARGLLGAHILGREFTFDIEMRRGAGAYICGEETALLNSIEGRRGEPRNKPPFPVQSGLFGKPTAVNNVETLVNVLPLLTGGAAAFAADGSGASTGTRLYCLSGCVERPGVYEIPYGVTLGTLLELAGGVRDGRPLQAILLGGAAGVFVRADALEMPLTLEAARAAGATLGSGVVMVFDDTVDLKPILRRIAAFFRDESCGQCVPCRVGAVRQEEALARLLAPDADPTAELALLAELEAVMRDASICGLGQTAASAISSAIHRLGLFQSDRR